MICHLALVGEPYTGLVGGFYANVTALTPKNQCERPEESTVDMRYL